MVLCWPISVILREFTLYLRDVFRHTLPIVRVGTDEEHAGKISSIRVYSPVVPTQLSI